MYFQETVGLEGHLIDSDILKRAFDSIVANKGEFEVEDFRIGRTNQEPSRIRISVKAGSQEDLDAILALLQELGASASLKDCSFEPAPKDSLLPDNFYSTTNYDTSIRVKGAWHDVQNLRMDSVIVWDGSKAACRKLAMVKKNDSVVVGHDGIRVKPLERSRDFSVFDFMSNSITAEANKEILIRQIAKEIKSIKSRGGKIAVVAGPAVIHSSADASLKRMIENGFVDALLTGNAFAVHDMEKSLFGTSLGVCQASGSVVQGGHRNHLRAINAINKCGSIENAVKTGVLKSGVMHACVKNNVKFVLAGSIRDDGPLADVITDSIEAQKKYIDALEGIELVIMAASTLHSIATGNLLKASVKTICVDINEAVPIKLSNRGSKQAIGIVTDVAFFFRALADALLYAKRV